MGVSKGEGGGRWSPPNGWRSLVLGEGGPCRIWRSGGFPKLSRKIFPLKPFPTHSHPFPPFFSPSTSSSNSFTSQTPPFNSLAQAFNSPCYPSTLFFLLQTPPTLSRPLSDLFRTPPESLYRVPKRPF